MPAMLCPHTRTKIIGLSSVMHFFIPTLRNAIPFEDRNHLACLADIGDGCPMIAVYAV